MKNITAEEDKIMKELFQEDNLTPESILIRYTSKHYLKESNGQLFLEAKAEPADMIIDRYHGNWRVFIASHVGQGISFLSERLDEYEREDRVCIEIQLKDIIDQGGLVYTVSSLPAYVKAYFCTLPEGKIKVKIN